MATKWTDIQFIGTINGNRGSRRSSQTVPLRVHYDEESGYVYTLGPRQRYALQTSILSLLLCGAKYLLQDPKTEKQIELPAVLTNYLLKAYGNKPKGYYLSHDEGFMWQTYNESLPDYQIKGMKKNMYWILENIGETLKEVDVL